MTDIRKQAEAAGFQTSFLDVWGERHDVSEETLTRLLEALGYEPEPGPPPVRVIRAEQPARFKLSGTWEIIEESGTRHNGRGDSLPALPMGYHRLRTEGHDTLLIASPPQCWQPEAMEEGERVWGVAAQAYGLRSDGNMGLGDYSDVAVLAEGAARLGADVVGLNPVHAMFPADPGHYSPYSPSNRLFLNTLYLDPQAIDGFGSEEVQAVWQDAGFQARIKQAREAELVDYPAVAALKTPLFEALFQWFEAKGDSGAFDRFREAQGELLHRQALFDALFEHFSKIKGDPSYFCDWPQAYQRPDASEVRDFEASHAERIRFHGWRQWQADRQLGEAQRRAKEAGMRLGLYRDLAVGSDGCGAEVWLDPARFIHGVAVGAPPDEYNPSGQNWGLPPFNPVVLRQRGYVPFIELLRANMRHAGALRIDHAFGLSRLYLIPQGAEEGAYLNYPFEEMLAVLRVESHRNRCVVIGEDLGTFPPGYKEAAAKAGVFSYRVFYFERDKEGFLPPDRYPARALATASTHDLPTIAGWWQGQDLTERSRMKLYPKPELQRCEAEERQGEKQRLLAALDVEGLKPEREEPPFLNEAVHRYLGRSPAGIVMVQLEDVLGMTVQANLPATTTGRPNWRLKLSEPLEAILTGKPLATLAEHMKDERRRPLMEVPRATYRLQLHKGFTFRDAARIIPYLAKLGISHVYASPFFTARPGSMHGYDVTDYTQFNPELGAEEGYHAFAAALSEHGLKLLLDFVPNHMGIGDHNLWWMEVLKHGPDSDYAGFFDIDWQVGGGKVILPVLGKEYEECLMAGELTLEKQGQDWFLRYYDHRFPVNPRDYPKAPPATSEELERLIARQAYRLVFWRRAPTAINYRRFFEINDLIGMRVEEPEVFNAIHAKALSLIRHKELHGLRIDHIDGLADPAGYLARLREKAGAGFYLTVEKILEPGESLPMGWPVQGTSGYDALNRIGNLFVLPEGIEALDGIYRRFTGIDTAYEEIVAEAKRGILETSFSAELDRLVGLLRQCGFDEPPEALKATLAELIARFPVYRSYVTLEGASEADRAVTHQAIEAARQSHSRHPGEGRGPDSPAEWIPAFAGMTAGQNGGNFWERLEALLTRDLAEPGEAADAFIRRFQQLTGPAMAKGLEDTVFYRFNRLISLNEVGGDPGHIEATIVDFHAQMQARSERFPHSMLATATHDTKRGEDMRLRLHLLSHMPETWQGWLTRWSAMNEAHVTEQSGRRIPSRNDEYFLYQTLLGSWPVEMLDEINTDDMAAYRERIRAYLRKAMREAKAETSWTDPDEIYENGALAFADAVLSGGGDEIRQAARELAYPGIVNSLAQTVLKLTLPGVPDMYQGCEGWDFSLVDPDNRGPVDYKTRQAALKMKDDLPALLSHWQDGQVKQMVIHRLLRHRAEHPGLYAHGNYEPLEAVDGIFAFRRRYEEHSLLVAVPVTPQATMARLILPPGRYRHLLTGMTVTDVTVMDALPLFAAEASADKRRPE